MAIIQKYPRSLAFALFVLLAVIAAWPVISAHPILDFDDFAILEPLQKLHSIGDYPQALSTHAVQDVQPVRDLSHLAEISVGTNSFQLDNLLIWIATIALLGAVLAELEVAPVTIAVITVLIGLHPVMHESVYWIAGRKHLLSAFFFLLALWPLLRFRKTGSAFLLVGSAASFLFSVFSQPISVGFPLLAIALLWNFRSLKSAFYLITCFAIAGFAAFVNAAYYASAAYGNTGGALAPKFRSESLELLGKRALVWGRDTFQLLIPIQPAIGPYNLHACASLVGIALLTAVLALVIVKRLRWTWLLMIALPIAVVTVRLTTQGGFDTYLLIPLLGLGIFLATSWPRLGERRVVIIISALILIGFCALDFRFAQAWSSKRLLWETALNWENSNTARAEFISQRSNDPNTDPVLLLEMSQELAKDDPSNVSNGYALGHSIYSQKISPAEKEKLFRENEVASVWYSYFWSANDARQGQFTVACDRLFKTWEMNPRSFILLTQFSIDDVRTKWSKMCDLAKSPRASEVATLINSELEKMHAETIAH